MNINWIIGFIEGEGNFSILFSKSKTSNMGYQISPSFAIKLVESEREILEKIRDFFDGIGNIYNESNRGSREKGMKNAKDSVSFRVTKLDEIKKIIEKLKEGNFVSPAKYSDFENWCKCVEIIERKEHLTREGFLKIAMIRDKIHKRTQWNKQNFCSFRNGFGICKVHKKENKIPESCQVYPKLFSKKSEEIFMECEH